MFVCSFFLFFSGCLIIYRWDGKGLSGHGKVIFDALSDLVDDTIKMFYDRHQVDVTKSVRDLVSV